jgi:hypothetical protein
MSALGAPRAKEIVSLPIAPESSNAFAGANSGAPELDTGMDGQTQARALGAREKAIAGLATRQHGVISRLQLRELGLGPGAIDARLQASRLHSVHRGVYALGHRRLTRYSRWMAAVLAYGNGALLSHRSSAQLWGLMSFRGGPIDVNSAHGRMGRAGIALHQGGVHTRDRAEKAAIPVTSVPRTLLDLAEVLDATRFERSCEEADRLGLLQLAELAEVCERHPHRHGAAACRRVIEAAAAPVLTKSALEDLFAAFCGERRLPTPARNVDLIGYEVDAFWPEQRLVVELDGFAFHGHRAAFERDRARDAALQAAGYSVVRVTYQRLVAEPSRIAEELRLLLRAG